MPGREEGHLHSSANLVASLSLTFRMTRSSMMSQKLYVQDITLHAIQSALLSTLLCRGAHSYQPDLTDQTQPCFMECISTARQG